jgi:hypothetical protein
LSPTLDTSCATIEEESMSEHEHDPDAEEIQDLDLDESDEGRGVSEDVIGGRPIGERPAPPRPPGFS